MNPTLYEKRSQTLQTLDEWQKLINHFEISEHDFAYFPVLVPDESWSKVCQSVLDVYLAKHQKKLHILEFTAAKDFTLLPTRIFSETFAVNTEAVWISTPIPFNTEQLSIWKEAWQIAISRLNQYRNSLTKNYKYTFLFVGGAWTQDITFTFAPDLWSIHTSIIRIEPPAEKVEVEKLIIEQNPLEKTAGTEIDPDFALRQAGRLRGKKGAEIARADLLLRAANGFNTYGKLPEAQKAIKAAKRIYRQFNSEEEFADALNMEGVILNKLGRLSNSIARFNEAAAIYKSLILPNNLASAYMNKGVSLDSLGNLEEAIVEYNKAIEIFERLVNELRQDQFANDLAKTYLNKGVSLRNLGKLEEAIVEYNEAIKIRERLVNELRQDQFANDLAKAYLNKGVSLRILGKLEEAIVEYNKAIEILERLVNELRQDQFANALASAYLNKGNVLSQLDKLSEATEIYGNAICLWEESLQIGNVQNLPNLIKAFRIRTKVFIKLEDWQNVGVDVAKAFDLEKKYKEHLSEHFRQLIGQEIGEIIHYLKELSPANREKVYAHLGEFAESVKGLVEQD